MANPMIFYLCSSVFHAQMKHLAEMVDYDLSVNYKIIC